MGYDRLFCVFQSHTYSRTAELFDDFADSFDSTDCVVFADIYAARETDTLGVSGKALADAVGERAVYVGGNDRIAEYLRENLTEGDVLVIMGAGDIYLLYDYLDIETEVN